MNNSEKKIFTPRQRDKLKNLAAYFDENTAITNFLHESSKFIASCTYLMTDDVTDEKIRVACGLSAQDVLKNLSHVLIALHLMKIHMLKDDFSEGLKKIQKENAREIDRLLKVFGKVGEDC